MCHNCYIYLLTIQTKLKYKQNFEGWQDCEVIKQKFEQLIELKHSMRLKYSIIGSVVSLAMFYIKGRERGTEAFSFLRSLIYANLSFFLLGLNSGSTLLFIASI